MWKQMHLNFEREYWASKLQHPDWYIRLEAELKQHFFPVVHNNPELKAFRNNVYDLVAGMLVSKSIPLTERGPDLDTERKAIDTIVIHHTEEEPAMSLDKLSAIGLIRQYAFQYLENNVLGYPVRGQSIWSGHFREGQMVFFAYHWLIRPDGTALRLLADQYIGWHAGHWDTNTRCIGIALSGNYEEDIPPFAQIFATAQVIRNHYAQVQKSRIIGHGEVREGVTCPGRFFLNGWKERLLETM
jgi:N-acetylmuramoyl-L-alanine amidase